MQVIKRILKEELSKREQIRARVKSLFLEGLVEGNPSIIPIKDMGFDYPGMEEDLREVAIEWGNKGIARMKAITPKTETEAVFITMFDGLYADTWFEQYPDSIYFFKGNTTNPEYWFELENSKFYCSYDRVWGIFSNEYSLDYTEVQQLIKPLVEEAFKMRSVTPPGRKEPSRHWWKKLSK